MTTSSSTAGPVFSDREIKYMAAACQSFKGDPQLDVPKFAELAGLTVGSARNAWAAIKKKLQAGNNGQDAETDSPAKATGRGRGGVGAGKAKATMKKPPTQTAGKKRSAAAMNTSSSDDDDEEPGDNGSDHEGNRDAELEKEVEPPKKKKSRGAVPQTKKTATKPRAGNGNVKGKGKAKGRAKGLRQGEMAWDVEDEEETVVKREVVDGDADADAEVDLIESGNGDAYEYGDGYEGGDFDEA